MRIEYYSSLDDKKHLKNLANQLGESTIHDDFIDRDGNPTDGISGRFTFGVKPDPEPRKILTNNQLNHKLKDRTLDLLELQDLIAMQALKSTSSRWDNFKSLFTG